MEDPIITTRAAAELLGVSIRTAQTWIEQNALDSWKTPGGHRRVRRSAVMDLMARLARERIHGPAMVLVHAPQHKMHRYVETLGVLPECTVRADSDPFATLLTADICYRQ
ncbi:excisionase family DNA-binding protein [Paraburkholderia strydomiana]